MRLFSIAALMVVSLAHSASAGVVTNATQLLSGGVTQLKLTNYEYLKDVAPLGTAGIIDVGDTLRGIFTITSGITLGDPNITLSGFELTGIFETEVLSVTPVAGGPGSFSDITFGASAAFGAEVGVAGAMIAFYEDFTPDFSIATIAGGEANATNGNLVLAIGAAPGAIFGTDYFWTSEGYSAVGDNGFFPAVTAFSASLQLLLNNLPVAFVGDQAQQPTPRFPASYATIQNEFGLQGNVRRNPFVASQFPLQSQDPIQFNGFALPEPASVAVWLGLTGLTLMPRRRIG